LLFGAAILKYAGPDQPANDVLFILNNLVSLLITFLLTFGAALVGASLLATIASINIMDKKRAYFRPGFDEYGRPNSARLTPFVKMGINMYELENKLYQFLERKKPRETAWDVWGLVSLYFLIFLLIWGPLSWLASIVVGQNAILRWFFGVVGSGVPLFWILQQIRYRNRLDR
jgi:hypothetical protein